MIHRTRREFLKDMAVTAGSAAALTLAPDDSHAASREKAMPRRVLGRTGVRVPVLGLGMAPLGSRETSFAEAEALVNHALDRGIRYLDVSPDYGNAEDKLKIVLKTRRDGTFLVTKVNPNPQDRSGVQRQLENSLRRMGVDHVDVVHIHNLGDFDMGRLFTPEGAIAGLKEAQKRGLCRFIGISGHMRPARFTTAIQTGDIDLAMVALNFADRYTYDFEGLALPPAKKHGTAIVAMKVLGGARNWAYNGKTPATLAEYHARAIRYSLGLPGVQAAVIGFSNTAEVDAAVEVVKGFQPLSKTERADLLREGQRLAKERGLYYGPVTG
ncbi:MAG: aldo/keto reductase [Armatimonadetes bacterium]|nr:aldo/keto reductase [Armatimonadota bacterium]